MKTLTIALSLMVLTCFSLSSTAQTTNAEYKVVNTIHLPENTGWDYLSCDAATGRLFVSRGTMVQVVDVKEGKLLDTIPNTDGVHGIALAEDLNKGFISDGRDSSVTVFNLKTLKVITKIPVTGRDPDAILYDPFTHRVFTCNGRAGNSTVIDARNDKVIGTIKLSGSPEFSATDGHGRIYINVEDSSQIDAINPKTMKIVNVWPLAPGEHPSGLAIDAKNHILFSVCHNKLMVVMDAKNGNIITTLPIGERVDGAAYDPGLKRAYSSNGDGTLTIVQEESRKEFKVIEQMPTQLGARTITVDLKTHHLFLPTAEFGTPPAATAEHPHPRPPMVPNSFVVLEVAPSDEGKGELNSTGSVNITKAMAEKIALKAVPGGKVMEAELEHEKGMYIWSLDVKANKKTKEIWISPKTGKVLNVFTESDSTEAHEKDLK